MDNDFSVDESSVANLVISRDKKKAYITRWIVIALVVVAFIGIGVGLGLGLGSKSGGTNPKVHNPKTEDLPEYQFSYRLQGQVRINEEEWQYSPRLSDRKTEEFQRYRRIFCEEISGAPGLADAEDLKCDIDSIRRGSVVIEFNAEVIHNKSSNATDKEVEKLKREERYKSSLQVIMLFMDQKGHIRSVPADDISIKGISILPLHGIVSLSGINHTVELLNQETQAFSDFELSFCDNIVGHLEGEGHTNYSCSVNAVDVNDGISRILCSLSQISEAKGNFADLREKVEAALRQMVGYTPGSSVFADGEDRLCDALSCDQVCSERTQIPTCSCQAGYQMHNTHCQDINECEENNGGCSNTCRNTVGSYKCEVCLNGKRCDGKDDCGDLSDERDCPCGTHETPCNVGPCIKDQYWCDGVRDCMDGSDEQRGCESGCPRSTFKCYTDFEKFKCLNKSLVCDKSADCIGAKDELMCSCGSRWERPAKCHWGMCLKHEDLCDGVNNCFDWSDEINCGGCPEFTVRCNAQTVRGNANDFYCVKAEFLCDSINDCPKGEDETAEACDIKKRAPKGCMGVEIDASKPGFFTSPNYPRRYPNNAECSWIIKADEGYSIRFHIDDFSLEEAKFDPTTYERTCIDAVVMYEGDTDPSWIGCGRKQGTFESVNSAVVIAFVSDGSVRDRGFKISYSTFKSECNLAPPARIPGTFHSPDYPSNYGPNRFCMWQISADIGYRVQITFTNIRLANSYLTECGDALFVYDGVLRDVDNLEENLVLQVCSYSSGRTILSESYAFTVMFRSDSVSSASGFSASYKQVWRGCDENTEFVCKDDPYKCVDLKRTCDHVADCADKSDEWDCDCDDNQFFCAAERVCMSRDWLCDSDVDCEGGQDEDNCDKCADGQFTCSDEVCVASYDVCDGVEHCSDGADEAFCVHLIPQDAEEADDNVGILVVGSGVVNATAVCDLHWNNEWSNLACRQQGFRNSKGFRSQPLSNVTNVEFSGMMTVSSETGKTSIFEGAQFGDVTSCSTIVRLACEDFPCGQPARDPEGNARAKVINGDMVNRESWPWMVSIHHSLNEGDHICGGSILNNYWILTAAHCIFGQPSDYSVYVGDEKNSGGDKHLVDEIIAHPNYISGSRDSAVTGYDMFLNDIAVLKLKTPVRYDDTTVMPVCLPNIHTHDSHYTRCYVTGWGQTLPEQGSGAATPERMRQGKLKILPVSDCKAYFTDHWDGLPFTLPYEVPVYSENHVCAEQLHGHIDSCYGDSGGPLNCEDVYGTWRVVGIVSHGDVLDCVSFTVYERVNQHIAWISNTTNAHGDGL